MVSCKREDFIVVDTTCLDTAMDISVTDAKPVRLPVWAKQPTQMVFMFEVTCGAWKAKVARSVSELEEFHALVRFISRIQKHIQAIS